MQSQLRGLDSTINVVTEVRERVIWERSAYHDAMLRFHEGRTKNAPGLDPKEAWLPVTPGLRDWRTQMPAPKLERFEAAAGDLLDALGYPRAYKDPSPAARQRAAQVRDQFIQSVQSKRRPLPDRLGPIGQNA